MFYYNCILIFYCNVIYLSNCELSTSPELSITGGSTANIEDYPYQVSLVYVDQHICGGSLITPNHVLSATHCTNLIKKLNFFKVRAGSSLINEGGTIIKVKKVFQHKNFNSKSFDYDIAVLLLERSFELSKYIGIIPLIQQDVEIPEDTMAIITGWGRLSEYGPVPTQLQKVSIPVLSDEICKLVYNDQVTERMICAGYPEGKKDACNGDSGGPITVDGVLIGITSWGDGCGEINSPGIYTKLSYFRDYVDTIIKSTENS